jgi:dihydrodipicolinate synthase/N-acetylneuraminate lyase
MILPALKLSCVGAVTVSSNVAPRLFADLQRAFREENLDEAAQLQDLVNRCAWHSASTHSPPLIKEAMDLTGLPASAASQLGRCHLRREPTFPLSQIGGEQETISLR